ncbi:MAG TPA: 50S ribosomal protein L11 methyltransferase [Chloroflexota bacterium]
MDEDPRSFVLRTTRLQQPPLVREIQLYLADEVIPMWRLVEEAQGGGDIVPPFWAFAWAGGQAIARYLLDHQGSVAGKRVLDFATGSGLCGITAARAGAAGVLAADIDPFCAAAVALNSEANGVFLEFTSADLLENDPPDVDLILAGDIFYERDVAPRVRAWLEKAYRQGVDVLMGDPNRDYFPRTDLTLLESYEVPTSRQLEGVSLKHAGVFAFKAHY